MKKSICVILAVALLAGSFLLCGTASANSWGLTGKLYQAVERSKAWEDYSTLSNQEGPFAVMQTRYHHALFFVDSQEHLHVYTTAVYQPETKRKAPKLYWDGHYLTISYGDSEYYTFCEWNEGSGEYQLSEAVVNEFRVTGIPGESGFSWRYQATDDDHDIAVAWPEKIMLADFNIDLFPHSVDEVCHLNDMHARFDSGLNVLGTAFSGDGYDPDHPGELLQPKKKGTTAVYSAPYGKSAWRAGKGKAAVGLNGDMWVLSQYKNEDGKSYVCIRYNVSERTQRIGYALCKDLGLPEIIDWHPDEPLTGFAHVDLEAITDTWLTDDPDVSQFQQFAVPKGTQFSCMGLYNDYYAYVSAEVKNDKFVDGGAIVWGFVPIRDLKPMEQEKQPEAMSKLVGNWKLEAGGFVRTCREQVPPVRCGFLCIEIWPWARS